MAHRDARTALVDTVRKQPAAPAEPGPATVVEPGDPRYAELVSGVNPRWVGTPDVVRVASTPEQVAGVVREAVAAGKKLAVRSGGHCYADFVTSSDVRILLDVSNLNGIHYDPERRAVCIGAGAQLGRIYETLYRTWGIAIPGGLCLTVGLGGHVSGGGFGMLSRRHGSVVDHLEAVEVVVVGADGAVRTVLASRDPQDPAHDLWWAIAGGGGGGFGVVTRFWFRSPDAEGDDPARALPRPPASVLFGAAGLPWSALDEDKFLTTTRNFSRWYEHNSAPDAPGTAMTSIYFAKSRAGDGLGMLTQADATAPRAREALQEFTAAVFEGLGTVPALPPRELPWLRSTKAILNNTLLNDLTLRTSVKGAWLRKGFSDEQLQAVYRNLHRTDYANPNGVFQLLGMGGRMNAPAPDATALVHRDSVMYAEFETFWNTAADDEQNLEWLRTLYGETFAATGGYPAPGEVFDGTNINNPDPDILDPKHNRSGADWGTLYWGANYQRLQQVKAHWDPSDTFRHAQSVRLPH